MRSWFVYGSLITSLVDEIRVAGTTSVICASARAGISPAGVCRAGRESRSQIVPPRPDQHMPAHVQAVVFQPRESANVCVRLYPAPHSPIHAGHFKSFSVDAALNNQHFLPVEAVLRRVADDARHLQGGAELKYRLPLLHAHHRARHQPPWASTTTTVKSPFRICSMRASAAVPAAQRHGRHRSTACAWQRIQRHALP